MANKQLTVPASKQINRCLYQWHVGQEKPSWDKALRAEGRFIRFLSVCLNVCLLKVPESFSSVTIRLSENPRPEETRVCTRAVTKNNILRSRTRSRWWRERERGSLDGDRGLHGSRQQAPPTATAAGKHIHTETRRNAKQQSRTYAQQEAVGSESCRTFMRWSQRDSTESAILTEEWVIWHQVWTSM